MVKTIRQHLEDAIKEHKHPDQYSKAEVNYTKGTPEEHCGNCEHFEVLHKNGCEIVKGVIKSGDYCDKWEIYEP